MKENMNNKLSEKDIRLIILEALVIQTIRGKLGMSRKIVLYKDKSINMVAVQRENRSGYFTDAFDGLDLWDDRNEALVQVLKKQVIGKASAADVAYAKGEVQKSLNLFMIYINELARNDQKNAVSLIETALCEVIVFYSRKIIDLRFQKGLGSGVIKLISAAVKEDGKRVRGTYEFQYGYMVNGVIIWVKLDSISKNSIILKGLKTEVPIYFRKRSSTSKSGMSKWCEPICTSVD
jgi:hypothetical protein